MCLLFSFPAPQSADKSSWILVISTSPNLVANMIIRGPLPLNAVQLVPSHMEGNDMNSFSDLMNAALLRSDSLNRIPFAGGLAQNVATNT